MIIMHAYQVVFTLIVLVSNQQSVYKKWTWSRCRHPVVCGLIVVWHFDVDILFFAVIIVFVL